MRAGRRRPVHRAWPGELKGLDKPVHVVAVRSEDRDEARRSPRSSGRPRLPLADGGRRWRRWSRSPWSPHWSPSRCARDAEGTRRSRRTRSASSTRSRARSPRRWSSRTRPGAVAASADAVWVTNPDVGTVTRIDPDEQAIVDTIQVGENPTGIAVGEGAVWVVESGGRRSRGSAPTRTRSSTRSRSGTARRASRSARVPSG